MAVRQETDDVKHHIQKVTSFFDEMRTFSHRLAGLGHRITYLYLDEELKTVTGNFALPAGVQPDEVDAWCLAFTSTPFNGCKLPIHEV